jgi:hypothetical protein
MIIGNELTAGGRGALAIASISSIASTLVDFDGELNWIPRIPCTVYDLAVNHIRFVGSFLRGREIARDSPSSSSGTEA